MLSISYVLVATKFADWDFTNWLSSDAQFQLDASMRWKTISHHEKIVNKLEL